MELILLPGNSLSIKEWVEEVETSFKDLFDSTYMMDYLHWENGKELISLEDELPRLVKYVDTKDNYAIFAKSVGILLALKGIIERSINPKFCIFVGTPVVSARQYNLGIDALIKGFKLHTLFIQNDRDPAGPFVILEKWLMQKKVKNYKLIELVGSTHDYDDIELLREHVVPFVALYRDR